ncbi:microsomal glutathione S-transferase 1-like [Mytilus trossulus]|uniref:microsomal glutathione S-transferase 1-like n=1 Tax=Mytilus trossulus TaxID=6551 RepID=UPI003007B44A
MADFSSTFSFENAIVSQFIFYATIVLLKMMLMSVWTSKNRISKEVYANVEDLKLSPNDKLKINTTDTDVERIRRCHQNDIENIIPFVLIGCFYCMTGPSPFIAGLHFRLFAACRIFHTIAYRFVIPQPARFIAFLGGWGITASMAVAVLGSATM